MVCLCAVELVTLVCSIEVNESGAAVESVLAVGSLRLAHRRQLVERHFVCRWKMLFSTSEAIEPLACLD